MRTIAVCSVVVFLLAVFGTAACAGGETQAELEILQERVDTLEDQVEGLQVKVEEELEEEPLQEQTQPEQTQPENTQ